MSDGGPAVGVKVVRGIWLAQWFGIGLCFRYINTWSVWMRGETIINRGYGSLRNQRHAVHVTPPAAMRSLVSKEHYSGAILGSALWREKSNSGVTLSRTSTVGENSVLGQGTEVGEGTSIKRSVIGRGCRIGKNVSIEGCHIWDNVTIEDDAQLEYSIVCDGATVKTGAALRPGVVLSFKVVIGPKFTVPAYSKISMMPQPTEEDSSDEELEYADAASGRAESPRSPFLEDGDSRNGSATGEEEEVDESGNWDPDEVGSTGAGYSWSRDGGQEEDWRHSVAPIPTEKIRELIKNLNESCKCGKYLCKIF